MANYNRKKGNRVLSAIAIILALLLIASVTLGIGMHFYGWFEDTGEDQTEILDEETADNNGMMVSTVSARGINLSLKSTTSDGDTPSLTSVSTSSTYSVSATITPSTASNQNVTIHG